MLFTWKRITESRGMKEGHLLKKEDKGTQPCWLVARRPISAKLNGQ